MAGDPLPFDLAIDTSAIMALLLDETTAQQISHALHVAESPVIAAPTLIELMIVSAAKLGDEGADRARAILDAANTICIPNDERLAETAFDGWQRFGKGNHPAALNFGDCFSYALATHYDLPLLYVGNDFAQTDGGGVIPTRRPSCPMSDERSSRAHRSSLISRRGRSGTRRCGRGDRRRRCHRHCGSR